MDRKAQLLARIDELLPPRSGAESTLNAEMCAGALSIAVMIYGPRSPQVRLIESMSGSHPGSSGFGSKVVGILKNMRAEIANDLIASIALEAKGEILADFVELAARALDDDARGAKGAKEVAAVLACAALEDTLKRYGEANDLDLDDKELSDVVNALKSRGLVKGPQGKILSTDFRRTSWRQGTSGVPSRSSLASASRARLERSCSTRRKRSGPLSYVAVSLSIQEGKMKRRGGGVDVLSAVGIAAAPGYSCILR